MESNEPGGLSRRTVAKGAAWAVPAAVALGAAPRAAASVPCVPTFSFTPASCKCPGQSTDHAYGYYLQICTSLANGCTAPGGSTTIYIWSVSTNNGTVLTGLPSTPYQLPLGSCDTNFLTLSGDSSPAKLKFVYSYSMNGPQSTSDAIFAPPDCPTVKKVCSPPTGASAARQAAQASSSTSSSSAATPTATSSATSAPATSTQAPAPTSTSAPAPTSAG